MVIVGAQAVRSGDTNRRRLDLRGALAICEEVFLQRGRC